MNKDITVNYISAIQSAIKAKAPIVGLPVPGARPFPVKRDLLRDGLKGLRITEASIQEPLIPSASRVLIVYAVSDRVKARRVFYPFAKDGRRSICQTQHKWTEAEREKQAKKRVTPKFSNPRERKIHQLKEAIKKHDSRYISRNIWWLRQRPWNAKPHEFTDGDRAAFLVWRNEKPIRRKLGKEYFLPLVNRTDGISIGRNPAKWIGEWGYRQAEWKPAHERYYYLRSEKRVELKAQLAAVEGILTSLDNREDKAA
jgi:hypothetical protein